VISKENLNFVLLDNESGVFQKFIQGNDFSGSKADAHQTCEAVAGNPLYVRGASGLLQWKVRQRENA
jgi:hypothetical protein